MFRLDSPAGWLLCMIALVLLPATACALVSMYTEDFTSKQYCDTVNTTAWWDTVGGELKLHPYTMQLAGTYDTPGAAYGVAVEGNYAYVADDDDGIQVIDISDPANPTLAGHYDTPGSAYDVAVRGNYAYVAEYYSGLRVIDISDPTNPISAGFNAYSEKANGVDVAGNFAYVADTGFGLLVFDITDPTNPSHVGGVNLLDDGYGVAVDGNYAFVAGGLAGLQVVDITDPTNPDSAGSCDTPGSARSVAVDGDHAYVADESSGLVVIDITDPTNPSQVGIYDSPGSAYGIAVTGDYAYLTDYDAGLWVIDISGPSLPASIQACNTPGLATDVALDGVYAYVADRGSGLQVIAIADTLSPPIQASIGDTPGYALNVRIAGNYAYVADHEGGLQVVDISDPENAFVAGSCTAADTSQGLAVSGNYAYVTTIFPSCFRVVDISDPTDPTLVWGHFCEGAPFGVAVDGDYAYVAAGDSGLRVFDISNPELAWHVGAYVSPIMGARDVAISGDHAYVGGRMLYVIDISDPVNPAWVADYFPEDHIWGVAVRGDYVYMAVRDYGLEIVDISDPTNPFQASSVELYGNPIRDVEVAGDYAYVVDGRRSLYAFDVRDPTNPVALWTYETLWYPVGIALAGDYALLASNQAGLEVVQLYYRTFDRLANVGQSTVIDQSEELIVRVRITTTQTDSVGWEVSADSGSDWTEIPPDEEWHELASYGDDLLWRSHHVLKDRLVNPLCFSLDLEWLFACPVIDRVVDIPGDQGGWVRIYFTRSGFDFPYTSPAVSTYGVWRRIDNPAFLATPRGAGTLEEGAEDATKDPTLLKGERQRMLAGHGTPLSSGFPPGTWEQIGSFAAMQQQDYIYASPTLGDSTAAGVPYAVYCISAHVAFSPDYYVCPPDSGYSVDNIPPTPPPGLRMESATELAWDGVPDEDLLHYAAYGSEIANFDEDATLIGYTGDLEMDVSAHTHYYYHVTAIDLGGNESDASSVANTYAGVLPGESGPDGDSGRCGTDLPVVFALKQNRPNPFAASTTIRFDLPEASRITLEVFDIEGRVIATIADEEWEAGRHSVSWGAQDASGEPAGPGVYFLRMKAGEFTAVRKMMVLR